MQTSKLKRSLDDAESEDGVSPAKVHKACDNYDVAKAKLELRNLPAVFLREQGKLNITSHQFSIKMIEEVISRLQTGLGDTMSLMRLLDEGLLKIEKQRQRSMNEMFDLHSATRARLTKEIAEKSKPAIDIESVFEKKRKELLESWKWPEEELTNIKNLPVWTSEHEIQIKLKYITGEFQESTVRFIEYNEYLENVSKADNKEKKPELQTGDYFTAIETGIEWKYVCRVPSCTQNYTSVNARTEHEASLGEDGNPHFSFQTWLHDVEAFFKDYLPVNRDIEEQ